MSVSPQFLTSSLEQIKGIGPKTAAALAKAGLVTIRDLLYYFPKSYEDYQSVTQISDLLPGKVMIKGQITQLRTIYTRRRNFIIVEGVVSDSSGSLRVVWYNQPYRVKAFNPEKTYYFTGEYDLKYNRYQLSSPTVFAADEIEQNETGFQPVYPARGRLGSTWFKRLFQKLRPIFLQIPDLLPLDLSSAPSYLIPQARAEALLNLHFPTSPASVDSARQYLAFEELFLLLLSAKLNQQANQRLSAPVLPFNPHQTKTLVASLPFKLTNAQRLATWEILQDLQKSTPMNRLLQGDVGSGKTVVAALAAHQVAVNGFQTALLAPTAILASQHAESLQALLKPFNIEVALLTGATKHKTILKSQIKNGSVQVVVGTHALLTDDTRFANLALCIVDEQHRFGVEQRQKLLEKALRSSISAASSSPASAAPRSQSPHFLAMTATPIPRSLQLTVFGDLDISILNQLPKGRQPISTTILPEHQIQEQLYPALRQCLVAKHQIYWICRSIDADSDTEAKSVKQQAVKLCQIFKNHRIECLHGRLKPAVKDQLMQEFAAGKIDILVSTTVVEVGVNVPNATHIVIIDAEHYGLAQLHQLRGRVGRGQFPSACYLLTTGENPPSRRLQELQRSTDGFHLAEVDLSLRGPGEIYGKLQHGALDLRIARLSDTKLVSAASRAAAAFAKTPDSMLKYPELANAVRQYQQLTTLN
ncbi:MAG: ATP-dependent DNA helicase RecG [Candidatus Saccharibacteria bacterium]|nr:ATP-dependent DNA helicase RecG [Candidatus Saccharibacteria bacterium]